MILGLALAAAAGAVLALTLERVGRGGRGRAAGREAAQGDGAEEGLPAAPEPSAREQVREALAAVARRLGARRAILWDVDLAHGLARPTIVTSGDRPPDIGLEGDSLGWAVREALPLRLETAQRWSRGGNGCAIPLRRQGAGALVTLEFAVEADLPDPQDLTFWGGYIQSFVRAESYQVDAARAKQRDWALFDILERLPAAGDVASFATELAEAARRLSGAEGGAVALWDGTQGTVLALAGEGADLPPDARFRSGESVLGLVPIGGQAAARERRREEARRLPVLAAGERWAVPPRAAAAFPLFEPHEQGPQAVRAVVAVWNLGEETFPPGALSAVKTVLPYAELFLKQVVAYGEVHAASRHDPLTGLANRRFFEERLAAEARRCDRYGRPLAVVMVDIDHFKRVNDTHGHDGGDAVLRALGDLLATSLRETDLPARLGGEEFVLLLPETPLDAAAETAERLRARVEALAIPWRGGTIPITASFGVSAAPECVPTSAALLESADAALYASKEAGRNRVTPAALVRK
ncbi:MAG TPA: GGDEF domain-containing protein [Longimicrobiales bacterium]